ncbi:amino acid adenylation domain-containing protein [Streptomyces sp. NPDC047000]|uniref:amino acid adenylation domain-containing protein n=1 Tax=Streptomyces sp. NPDC047000 TaxID=3155474 RepID=UPI0033CA2215
MTGSPSRPTGPAPAVAPSALADAALAQARRTPGAPAVEDGAVVLDYAALDRASRQVAAVLRAEGVRPGDAVAVRLPRSWRLVCVLLGIRRLGATVVPLDRLSPPDRQRHILDDSGAVAVVHDGTTEPTEAVPPGAALPVALPVDRLLGAPETPAAAPDAHVPGARGADEPVPHPTGPPAPAAFVFYTSGTTGRPKGVEVTDDGVLRLARPGYLDARPGDRYACLSNPAFDALSFEVWTPLLTGGTCVVLDDTQVSSPLLLADALRDLDVRTLFVTTALFNAVTDEVPGCFGTAGQVLIGGEQLDARRIRRWYAANPDSAAVLHNAYGPTEATTFALSHPVPRDFDGEVVPIGTPLPGTGILLHITDGRTTDGRTAEPGEVAELLLSGPALALGYRNLPEETARRFVRLPGPDGGERRWYRTGDLVRQDPDGLVTYVGRADRQVKVRGFRIEPGEVERRVLAHPGVRQVHVCTRRDEAGRNELLAFVAPAGDLAFDAYDRHLTAALPPYMRPHRTHLVDALPLNANGKVDQDALLRTAGTPWRAPHRDTPPATPAQQRVLDLAGEVLGVTGLRPDDRWIPHGGDSLKALRFRFQILRRFGVDVPQELVLRADFAAVADAVHAADATPGDVPPVTVAPGERTAPATGEQERLWLLHQRDPLDGAYDVPVVLALHGTPDTAALRHALRTLVERHPALRTRLVPTAHGLRQQIDEPYDPWEPTGTASGATAPATGSGDGWEHAADRFFAHRFDLTGSRMLRAAWLPAGDGGHLLLHLHHVAVDGWSLTLLFRDLGDAYTDARTDTRAAAEGAPAEPGTALPEPGGAPDTATTLDFARWQRDWHATPAYAARRARLRAHHAAHPDLSPALEQPSGTPGPPRAGLLHTSLGIGHRAALDRIAADSGLTRFEVLLPAFAWALYGVTGQTRPLIAAPVAGRPRPELSDSVGMFANTVLVPLSLEAHGTLGGQLPAQSASVREVLAGQDVALADVLADHTFRDQGPLFDFLFVLENTDFTGLRLPGCRVRPVWSRPLGAKCALTVSLVEHEDGFDCLWEYRDDIGADRARAAARLFREALDALAHGGRVTLRELITPYRRALPETGRGPAPEPGFTTVAEGFARQVARTPGAPAVTGRAGTHSYAELDALAEGLARDLVTRHPLPGDPAAPASVALYLPPSADHVAALLAAARLNLTVVPLDPAYPPALLRQILEQADPLCVLVTAERAADLDALAPPGLPRHVITSAPAGPVTAPAVAPRHQGLRPLYTLFTSGSTGTPKGVQVSDRTLCNLLTWQAGPGGLGRPAVTQQFSMLSFDVSFQEIFTTLCAGGTLRLVEPAWRQDIPALLDELETGGAERIFLPYVALQLLAEHGVRTGRHPSRLREVITAGEQLVCTDAVRRWFAGLPGARLFNHYGPTETHVVSALCLEGDPAAWPLRPAVGRPVAGAVLRVVDETGAPVPPGATGQLLIGGLMAERCYLGDAALNRDRFTDDPELGTFYRSGDLARFDTDGLLHYSGRDDAQIKLSGHRLEPGQVETALLGFPGVTAATVLAVRGSLVACLRCEGADPDPADLNRHLSGLLPAHVRVARFRCLTSLPRTPSGKLDRRAALTAPGHDLTPRTAAGHALSALETRLTTLFEQVTGRTAGPDQRFFDTGATSLDLMRFQLRCAGEDDLPFTVPELFEHVTVRALAALVGARRDPRPPGENPTGHLPAGEPGREPTSGAGRDLAAEPVAVVGMAVRLPGAPDLAAFWDLVTSGGRGIEHFPATGGRVGARSQLPRPLGFDPARFGISPAEARLTDPQQRQLLMTCVEALAHAGLAEPGAHRVGLVAACGENTYFQSMLREADPAALPDPFRLALHHEKDFLATKAAYHLGLTGPAFTVQSACSSSLVGVHVAAGLLRQGDADTMLVGGVLVDPELTDGYTYRPQHIFSPDGHCRPFSADAEGTVGASGTGVVVLKPLAAARRDGDTVYAVITGSAINNDGSAKLGYSAPSLTGQRDAIRAALARSGRSAADLGYIEAHGTGTRLGDPVEAAALRQAYGLGDDAGLALSSVKSQLGHLGAAAGVVGLVRAVLAVHHGVVPPTADFDRLNPEIGEGPFRVPTAAEPWPRTGPRVAAVSSFGIGGTNAHLLLEAPYGTAAPVTGSDPEPSLVLSAHSRTTLRADARRVADYLAAHPAAYPRVLRHLRTGRPALAHRAEAVCPDAGSAVAWLRSVGAAETEGPGTPVTLPAGGSPATAPAGHTAAPPRDAGPAPAPWDFPPPAFDITDHDFPRRTSPAAQTPPAAQTAPAEPAARTADGAAGPARLPGDRWLHQPVWTRLRRAHTAASPASRRTAVAVVAADADPAAWRAALEPSYHRVVVVQAGAPGDRAPDGDRHRRADPADPGHLTALLAETAARAGGEAADGVDWLHALPLAVDGEVGEHSLETARWACLDTVAALCTALADTPAAHRPRVWLLSRQAQPVTAPVVRPEPGLLAAAVRIPRQELGITLRWADLPGPDPADWAPYLSDLPDLPVTGHGDGDAGDDPLTPAMTALRDGYWWHRTVQPAAHTPAAPPRRPGGGTHLVLGGTGGIGATLAARLLGQDGDRVVLVARRTVLPPALAPYAGRVTTVEADLAEEDLAAIRERLVPHLDRLVSVVHAVGTPGGGLLARRDPERARRDTAAKLRGALLLERLISDHAPDHAVYCSSMAALFGGTGQFDYAAANGCLDAFAAYAPDGTGRATVRTSIGWDAWREVGMAQHALSQDARHQAHLSVALTPEDGAEVFAQALRLQLPHLMVSTTALTDASRFYAAPRPTAPDVPAPAPAHAGGHGSDHARGPAPSGLADLVCDLLGVDTVDPDASLYDLGADSLTLLDLVVEVQRRYGTDIDLSRLSHRVSLTELAGHLGGDGDGAPPARDGTGPSVETEVWQYGDGPDVLVLVHPVGGDIQAYRALVAALPPNLTVCLVPDPALRAPGHPTGSIEERAERYLAAVRARFPQPGRRISLAGWSFGAWTALSMAAAAERAGGPAHALYLLDPPPSDAGPRLGDYDERQIDAVFARELSGNDDGRLTEQGRRYAERLAHCCRANLAAMAAHRLPRLTGTPATLWLAGRPVPDVSMLAPDPAADGDWHLRLPPPVRTHHVDADHYGLMTEPHVRTVAAVIEKDLTAAPRDSSTTSADTSTTPADTGNR